ncbi:MAG: ABC transporter ATP-binding protein [Chloroflexales bacterium]|nr:ABC transporter ATP-binding protein [Chloroflexales bacterium]
MAAVDRVDRVDLAVPAGSFLALLGPSGCGKTTILRMLAGLEEPSGGEIVFGERTVADGRHGAMVPPGQRDAGLVFQSYALWPHMTVRENISWPLKVKGWGGAAIRARADEVLELLAISALAERYPHQISGGQQQRVAIARTIAPRPQILLFDEPLSNLDARLRVEMRSELLRVHRATGATSVYVTHDQVEAMTMASHVAVMRAGHVEQFGAPYDLLTAPATPFVATFIGTPPANLIPARSEGGVYRYKDLILGAADGVLRPLLLMYRAESLRLRAEPGERCLPVEFAEATPMAGRVIVTVWEAGRRVTVVCDTREAYRVSDTIFLEFPPRPDAVFPQEDAL